MLGLMSLQRRRERYTLLIMWKILHEILPNDLKITFRPKDRRLGIQAIIPSLPRNCSLRNRTLYDSSFAVLGPTIWNKLPSWLNTIPSEDLFKKKLTAYLIELEDEPPVRGYQRAHNNTLADVTRRLRLRRPIWRSYKSMKKKKNDTRSCVGTSRYRYNRCSFLCHIEKQILAL